MVAAKRLWLVLALLFLGPASGLVLTGCNNDDGGGVQPDTEGDNTGSQFATNWLLSERLPVTSGAVATNGETAVVVGPRANDGTIVAFYSPDGSTWEPGEGYPEIMFFGPAAAVTAGSKGFVSVATANGAVPRRPVVVFSADGAEWEAIADEDLPASEVYLLTDVVAGTDGFVIVADVEEGALTWFSEDGRRWVGTDLPTVDGELTVATSGSDWMAVGGHAQSVEEPALVFTSPDGRHWTEVENQASLPAEVVSAYEGAAPLSALGDTWVLAPRELGRGGSTLWVSTDRGETWTERALDQNLSRVRDMALLDHGVTIVGTQGGPDAATEEHFLLYAEDDTGWHYYPSTSEYVSIASFGDDLIALDSDGNIFVWSRT